MLRRSEAARSRNMSPETWYRLALTVAHVTLAVSGLLAAASVARAEDATIGFVKTVSGTATVIHDGTSEKAVLGTPLRERNRIETGPGGSIGITFIDNTRLALGPSSSVELDRFEFKPADQRYALVIRLLDGTLDYISGLTAKLAPEAISIETPTATVGVRGTHLLLRAEG
jgi:hypothetical protein